MWELMRRSIAIPRPSTLTQCHFQIYLTFKQCHFLIYLTFKHCLIRSKIFPHCLNILFILLWLTLVYNMIIKYLKYSHYKSTFNIQGWILCHVCIRFSPLEPTIMQYLTFMNFIKLPNNCLMIIDTFHISILHYIRKKYTVPSAEWKTTVSPSVIPRQLTF